jgi:hypothetical protein
MVTAELRFEVEQALVSRKSPFQTFRIKRSDAVAVVAFDPQDVPFAQIRQANLIACTQIFKTPL